jgi:hypothetical protein
MMIEMAKCLSSLSLPTLYDPEPGPDVGCAKVASGYIIQPVHHRLVRAREMIALQMNIHVTVRPVQHPLPKNVPIGGVRLQLAQKGDQGGLLPRRQLHAQDEVEEFHTPDNRLSLLWRLLTSIILVRAHSQQ